MTVIYFWLLVFSLSSGWLFSPGPSWLRDGWEEYFTRSKWFSHLKWLSICQLCVSFWFAIGTEWIFYEFNGDYIAYIIIALCASSVSWTLGAFTTACLWIKAYYELKVTVLCQESKSQLEARK